MSNECCTYVVCTHDSVPAQRPSEVRVARVDSAVANADATESNVRSAAVRFRLWNASFTIGAWILRLTSLRIAEASTTLGVHGHVEAIPRFRVAEIQRARKSVGTVFLVSTSTNTLPTTGVEQAFVVRYITRRVVRLSFDTTFSRLHVANAKFATVGRRWAVLIDLATAFTGFRLTFAEPQVALRDVTRTCRITAEAVVGRVLTRLVRKTLVDAAIHAIVT